MDIHGYTKAGFIAATIEGTRMDVPDDMSNRHRRMIADWEAKGNTIPPYVAPVPDYDAKDIAAIEAALSRNGAVDRAFMVLVFKRMNAMSQAIANATTLLALKRDFPKPVTIEQFKAAMKNEMRNGS